MHWLPAPPLPLPLQASPAKCISLRSRCIAVSAEGVRATPISEVVCGGGFGCTPLLLRARATFSTPPHATASEKADSFQEFRGAGGIMRALFENRIRPPFLPPSLWHTLQHNALFFSSRSSGGLALIKFRGRKEPIKSPTESSLISTKGEEEQ